MSKIWFTSGAFRALSNEVLGFVGVDPVEEHEDGDGVSLVVDDVGVEPILLSPEDSSTKSGLKVVMTQAAAMRLGLNDENTSCAEHIVINVSECFRKVSGVIPMIAWN